MQPSALDDFKKTQHLKEVRPPVLWLIGNSRSGKSPIAQKALIPLGFDVIGSSEFHKKQHAHIVAKYEAMVGDPEDIKRGFIEEFSVASTAHLAAYPHDNINDMMGRVLASGKPCVIEGARNPYEFLTLLAPHKDMVIFLDRTNVEKYSTQPERSLPVLEANVRHLLGAGFIRDGHAFRIEVHATHYKVFKMGELADTLVSETPEGHFANDYAGIDALIPVVAQLSKPLVP